MPQWIIGYVVGAYGGAGVLGATIPLYVPGPIRRIVSGFYIEGNNTVPFPLAPKVTAAVADDVQITNPATSAGKRAVRIYTGAQIDDVVVFLFVETELGVGEKIGTPHAITP